MSQPNSLSNLRTTTTIQVEDDVRAVKIQRVYRNSLRFSRMPLINSLTHQSGEPDLLDLFGEMSKGAIKLFLQAKQNYLWKTGTSYLPSDGLTKGQMNKRAVAAKELSDLGLMAKVPCTGITALDGNLYAFKVNTFMISPHYLHPHEDYQEQIHHVWEQIK